jgi:hypothetical protein
MKIQLRSKFKKQIGLILLVAACFISSFHSQAQSPGDTIVVKAFKYGSATRDTFLQFPTGNLTFEKIIMKYNMRCKNGLISTQSAPNQGCGEWDYSCNTFVVDSTKIENELNTRPKYVITNFTGNNFNYTNLPLYDYFNYAQTQVTLNTIVSETQHTIGSGTTSAPNALKLNERSGRTQILYTAAELTAAGLTAGNLDGFILNVANTGGNANFLSVGIQHSNQVSLNSGTVVLSGFTNVFNANKTFTSGSNRIQFHTPFVWNGTGNVLIDYSFTNTGASTPIVLNGTSTSSITCLYANNNYALDLSASGHVTINPSMFSGVNTELTVSFWAYGTGSLMPTNTSILYGYGSSSSQRNLNLHLPWGNGSVYFDCGYNSGNFDRIDKPATAAQQGGQWNHWAFTKNATSGVMNIYLNGTLWHTGTGKTKLISLLNVILGKDNSLSNNYKGSINELTFWDKALSLTDIQNWMNKPIDGSHPFYGNLLAYYTMNEGGGLTVADSKFVLNSSGVNLQWTYDRGNKLVRSFFQTNIRPNIVFVRGTYAMTTNSVSVKDSIARNPNIIETYSVVSNASVVPMTSDLVNLVSTTSAYEASFVNVYNGDTGLLTGTIAVTSQGTYSQVTLNYFKRYPYYNEIMSFVTPYGKGLDMGIKGKTWYYDVSDFAPLLKGGKRFMMANGGEYQEQMDIDFWFIVGTPPRTVLEFNQLWQGAARIGGIGIASINNDSRFNTQTVSIHPSGSVFKVRSTITGHGGQGEFQQNGGQITHFFDVNGGNTEFSWPVTMKCGLNPVFPQGGTWVYDRQGWCPGMASVLTENDITPYVTPGNTVTLDYNCSGPNVSNGDYRYLAAHQLVSYGPANHTLDAAIVDVLTPSKKVFYSLFNPMCASPRVQVKNTGSSVITDIEFEFWINNSPVKETFNWSGTLIYMDTTTVNLPVGALWTNGLQPSDNVFHVEIKKINGLTDGYAFNNQYHSPFNMPDIRPNELIVEFKTNNNPGESTYKIVDDFDAEVPGASPLVNANTTYNDSYLLNGCYKLVVQDFGGDGLQWWANTSQGNGYVRIKNSAGTILKSFLSDFGSGFEYSFSTQAPNYVSVEENVFAYGIKVFPNPAHDKIQVSGNDLEVSTVKLTDMLGRVLEVPMAKDKTGITFDVSFLRAGLYLISITNGSETAVKKIVVQ